MKIILVQISNSFSLEDPIIRNVIVGSVLLSICASIIGCFTLLRKRALVGDAISHAVLPGVCLAFVLQGNKEPLGLLFGAFVTGWLSISVMDFVNKRTKISEDTSIALVLSVFFAVGTLLLSIIQHLPDLPDKSGLNHFLFGSAVAISNNDLLLFGGIALVIILVVFIFYKAFLLLSFDELYSQSIGLPVSLLRILLTSLTVASVVIGIQAVGVVLMAAMLITPAATSRFWASRLPVMLALSVLFGGISAIGGTFGSYVTNSPTGPWIVMVLSMIAVGSFLFAPQRGIISNLLRQRRYQRKIREENILKAIYQLGERNEAFFEEFTFRDILRKRPMATNELRDGLKRLTAHGYLDKESNTWAFTKEGKSRGQRLVKLHRLWEVYLTQYLRIAEDHVHDDADTIEHIITPELEKRLEELLNFPTKDPHQSAIPYSHQNASIKHE